MTKTNPYKSIEQYKIFFKNKFFGVKFQDDYLETCIENYFEDYSIENFTDTSLFEFNFITNDLFNWDECVISSLELIKFEFLDLKIDTCILSMLTYFDEKQNNNSNKFFLDFKLLYLHSNCLYNHKMEGRNHSSDSLASNSSNSNLGRDSASSSRGLHF